MLINWWESLTLSALSLHGAEGCHFYCHAAEVERVEKIPHARARLLTNQPQAGEHKWNWPLWCFYTRMQELLALRSALLQ